MTREAFDKCVSFCDGYLAGDLKWVKEKGKERVFYEGREECIEIRYSRFRLKEDRSKEFYDE